jgi:hypothetical protein
MKHKGRSAGAAFVFAIDHGGIVTADEARVCEEIGGLEIGFGFEGSEEAGFPLRELGFCSRLKHGWCSSSGDIHNFHSFAQAKISMEGTTVSDEGKSHFVTEEQSSRRRE